LLPVQRICKYPLLFREWLKVKPSQVVQDAASNLEATVNYVNEYKRRQERIKFLTDLSDRIEDWPLNV
jgi:hypothetical protein